ncbi:MAG: DUF6776 family protein [Pseudomonadota bacterium]
MVAAVKRMKSGKLIVKTHDPLRSWGMRAALAGIVLITAWALYYMGGKNAGFDRLDALDDQQQLKDVIAQVEREKSELREKLALLDRSVQVDKQAYNDLDVGNKTSQQEILELREEVAFYRGIVAPDENSQGLRIDNMKLEKAGEDRLYHYRLVVTQVLKNDRTAHGRVDVFVDGLEGDKPKRIELAQISPQRGRDFEFNLRYFQRFEGDLKLPSGFSPRSVVVEVKSQNRPAITKVFEWRESANGTVSTTSAGAAPVTHNTP